jgi:hypothetical protein
MPRFGGVPYRFNMAHLLDRLLLPLYRRGMPLKSRERIRT